MDLDRAAQPFWDKLSEHLSSAELSKVQAAWQLAVKAHDGQLRQSGEPYVTHPLAVAEILFESFDADADALCAALLHDVVEDTDYALNDIRAQFGSAVALIVDGVSKLAAVSADQLNESKENTLRKLVLAGGSDRRVFAVKLADRLHNMRTLGAVSPAKRMRVSRETYQIYCPLSRYAGFRYLSTELESLALRGMYPWRWEVIRKWAHLKHRFDVQRIAAAIEHLPDVSRLIEDSARSVDTSASLIHAASLLRSDLSSRALFAVPVFQVPVPSFADAYTALAQVHAQFAHVPGSFHCEPHEGMISARLLISRSGPVAELVFTFPRLRGHKSSSSIDDTSFGDDFSAVASSQDPSGGFTKTLRDLITQSSVSVFSPKGKVFVLPKRSTVLDFAFSVHTDIGLRAKAARVNGLLRPIRHELVSGDIVDVLVGEEVTALPEWDAMLHSPRSKSKLRQWLRDSTRESTTALGARMLGQALLNAQLDESLSSHDWGHLLQATDSKDLNEALFKIGSGDYAPSLAVDGLSNAPQLGLLSVTSSHDRLSRLRLNGEKGQGVNYCRVCQPVPGDDIFALMSSDGITVHREGCQTVSGNRSARTYVYPSWSEAIKAPLSTRFQIQVMDRHGMLADCARKIADLGIDVLAVQSASKRKHDSASARLEFEVLVTNKSELEHCFQALQTVTGVSSIARLGTKNAE